MAVILTAGALTMRTYQTSGRARTTTGRSEGAGGSLAFEGRRRDF